MGRSWIWRLVSWDGILPWSIAMLGAGLSRLPAGPVKLDLFAAFLPAVAAGLRWIFGKDQIRESCGGAVPTSRLLLLALALFTLCIFEALSFLSNFMVGATRLPWDVLLGLFAVYLVAMAGAIRPGTGPGGSEVV